MQDLQAGLMWVAEQIPGLTAAADMTATLERGYWPSYNVPFFREVGYECTLPTPGLPDHEVPVLRTAAADMAATPDLQ